MRIRFSVLLMMMLSVLLLSNRTGAQEDPLPPPLRNVDREAPEREPKVLERTIMPDQAVNTIIALPATADAYIASERPFQNFGSDSLFLGYNLVGSDNFGAQRILLRFDVNTFVPDDAVIHSATLRLHVSLSVPDDDVPMGTAMRRVASPWNEETVTWQTEPAWTDIDATADVPSSLAWVDWDITSEVDAWVNGSVPNNGIEIIGDERVQERERAFYARETSGDRYPRLVINYTDINDDQPPSVSVDPLPTYSSRSFEVTWSGSDNGAAGIDYYDVQYRIDGGAWQDWKLGTTATSAGFSNGENGRFYQFRARGVDNVGNVEPFSDPEAGTTVDSVPPTAQVNPLPAITPNNSFTVTWSGSDGVSGISRYDVRYRPRTGTWSNWQTNTTDTSAIFAAPQDGIYDFEARAVDGAGLVESFSSTGEASIIVDANPPFLQQRVWMPIISMQ